MESIEVSAKTVDDAVLEAAIQLGVTRDSVVYEVISQGSTGFFGIGSKKAVIRAHQKTEEETEVFQKADQEMKKILKKVNEKESETPKTETGTEKKEEKKEPSAPVKEEKHSQKEQSSAAVAEVKKAEPEKPLTPAKPVDTTEVEKFLKDVFAAMEMNVEIHIQQDTMAREMIINLKGDDMGVLIGKRGQTLDSLQYLTSLVANKHTEEYFRVKVDTENYRERRKATLENLAKNIAQKVKRTGKPVSLEPMNPYERRVIHSSLQNDKFVCTHSEGEEPYRRVVVTLKEGVRVERSGNNNRSRNRYNRNYNNRKKER